MCPRLDRSTSTKAKHRQLQPVSSQETLPRACENTLFLPQTGKRALHKHTELLVKKGAEPGLSAATQLREGMTKLPLHCLAGQNHTPQDALITGTRLPRTLRRS